MNPSTVIRRPSLTQRPAWQKGQSAVLVVLFTGLIWWTANQAVSMTRSFAVRLRLAKAPGLTIRVLSGDEFNVTLSGPQRLLDAFEARLRSHGDILDYSLSKDEAQPAERVEWKARDVLSNTALLAASGLTVGETTPAEVAISIDTLVTAQMTVQPEYGAVEVDATSVSPATVKVTLAERELAQHARRLTPNVELQLSNWRSEHPDAQTFSINVPLALPWVVERIDPPSVTVSGRVIQLLETAMKGPVQILPAIPVTVQRKYTVEPASEEDFRTDLNVRGPKDLLAGLSTEQIRAYFDVLTADEGLAGQTITRRAIVVLPRGFELVGDPPEVRFRLNLRDAAVDATP